MPETKNPPDLSGIVNLQLRGSVTKNGRRVFIVFGFLLHEHVEALMAEHGGHDLRLVARALFTESRVGVDETSWDQSIEDVLERGLAPLKKEVR